MVYIVQTRSVPILYAEETKTLRVILNATCSTNNRQILSYFNISF